MALWSNSVINTNETAMVFNKLHNSGKAEAIVKKKNGLFYLVMGKAEKNSTPNKVEVNFDTQTSVTGKNIEQKLRGKNVTPAGVTDGANEIAAATLTYVDNIWGAAEFPVAHIILTHPLPQSEVDRFAGDELKTLSYLDEVYQLLIDSYENIYGNAINTSAAPSRTVFGGYPYAIHTTNVYGTVDRNDALNADFRGIVTTGVGNLTLGKIRLTRNRAKENGGKPRVGVSGTAVHTVVETLVEAYVHADYHDDWAAFGSEYTMYNGVCYTQDQRAPSGQLSLLDPDSWAYYRNKKIPFSKGITNAPWLAASYVVQCVQWTQFFCKNPGWNCRFEDIIAAAA